MKAPQAGDPVLTTLDGWQTTQVQVVTAAEEIGSACVVETGDGHSYTSLRGPKIGPQQWGFLPSGPHSPLNSWEIQALARLTEPTPQFDQIVEVARARLAEQGLLTKPRISHEAYILGLMDYKTHKLNGVGIYSEDERNITHTGDGAWVRLGTAEGMSYQEAHDYAIADLKGDWFKWLGPLRDTCLEHEGVTP